MLFIRSIETNQRFLSVALMLFALTLNCLVFGHTGLSSSEDEFSTCPSGICEPCPPDSESTLDGDCVCDMEKCDNTTSLICSNNLVKDLVRKGSNEPGECCDIYHCIEKPDLNCTGVICPVDTEECPEDSYKLPAHKSPYECCSKPQGCQCSPCVTVDCPKGFVSVVVQKASKKPGQCCPLYTCSTPEHDVAVEVAHEEPVSEPHPGGCITADGKLVENDATWMEESCTNCTCQKGRRMCQAFMCQISCAKPVDIPGECCPVCDTSSIQAVPSYCSPFNCSLHCVHGFVQDNSGCFTCQCQQEECVLTCPDGFATDAQGTKLCKCAENVSSINETAVCPTLIGCDKICPHGFRVNQQGCKLCECDSCKPLADCAKHCKHGFANDEKGCKICLCNPAPSQKSTDLGISADKKTCELDGKVINNGELVYNTCDSCYCYNGEMYCTTSYCSEPLCSSDLVVVEKTSCCPYCLDDPIKNMVNSLKCQSQNGTDYANGEKFTFDGCIRCVCYNGLSYCTKPDCPPTPCSNPRAPLSGQCCPTCPDIDYSLKNISKNAVNCRAGTYDGTLWKNLNCSSCLCDGNRTECYREFCSEQLLRLNDTVTKFKDSDNVLYSVQSNDNELTITETCQKRFRIGNSCCKTCIGKAKFSPVDGDCIYENKTYAAGSKWLHSTCEYCQCERQTIRCARVKCTLPCLSSDRENGRCCCTGVLQELGYIVILLATICLGILVTRCIMKQWRSKRQMRIRDFTNSSHLSSSQKCAYKYIPASPTYEIPLSKKPPHGKCSISANIYS